MPRVVKPLPMPPELTEADQEEALKLGRMTDELLKRLEVEVTTVRGAFNIARTLATLERVRSEREHRMKRNVRALTSAMSPAEAKTVVVDYMQSLTLQEYHAVAAEIRAARGLPPIARPVESLPDWAKTSNPPENGHISPENVVPIEESAGG
jgi:hypothetical protein